MNDREDINEKTGDETIAERYFYAAMDIFHTLDTSSSVEEIIKAKKFAEQALEQNPEHVDTLVLNGLIQLKLGQHQMALVFIEHALAIDPTNQEALKSKGWILLELGKYDQALEVYNKYFQLVGWQDWLTFNHILDILPSEERRKLLEQAWGQTFPAPVAVRHWREIRLAGNRQQPLSSWDYIEPEVRSALEMLQNLAGWQPKAEIWNELALWYNALGKKKEAVSAAEHAVELPIDERIDSQLDETEKRSTYWANLAACLFEMLEWSTNLSDIIGNTPPGVDPAQHIKKRSLEAARRGTELSPQSIFARRVYTEALYVNNDYAGVLDEGYKILAIPPGSDESGLEEIAIFFSKAFRRLGELDKAINILRERLSKPGAKNRWELTRIIISHYLNSREITDEALVLFHSFVEEEHDEFLTTCIYRDLIRLGKTDRAWDFIAPYFKLDNKDRGGLFTDPSMLSQWDHENFMIWRLWYPGPDENWFDIEDMDVTFKDYHNKVNEQLMELFPTHPVLLLLNAAETIDEEKYQPAEKFLLAALDNCKTETFKPTILNNLAFICLEKGQYLEAGQLLEQLQVMCDADVEFLNGSAMAHYSVGFGKKWFRGRDNLQISAALNRLSVMINTGALDKASEVAVRLLVENKENQTIGFQALAMVELARGNKDIALLAWDRATANS